MRNHLDFINKFLLLIALVLVFIGGLFYLDQENSFNSKTNRVVIKTPEKVSASVLNSSNLENLAPKEVPKQKIPDRASSLHWVKSEKVPWGARDSHTAYVFEDKLWITGGLNANNSKIDGSPDYDNAKYYNDIWNTEDGEEWVKVAEHADYPEIRSASIIEFNGSLFKMAGWVPGTGVTNSIWKSEDGVKWKKVSDSAAWEAREGQRVVEFEDKLWLIGGVNYEEYKTFNDVWSSEDGLNWKKVTLNAPWHSRWDHDVAVFQDKMWIMGGMNRGGVGYGDLWNSSDGKNWDLVYERAPWGKRQGHETVVFENKMWLISGLDAASNQGAGDTWFTSDGYIWEKTADNYSALAREDIEVKVFNDKMWFIAGMDKNWHWNADVWHSDF